MKDAIAVCGASLAIGLGVGLLFGAQLELFEISKNEGIVLIAFISFLLATAGFGLGYYFGYHDGITETCRMFKREMRDTK